MLRMILTAALLTILATPAWAELRTQQVQYRHGDANLEGYLAWDDAQTGKRPGVLVVHEWWGLNDYARSRAEQLAELGYVAMAVDMYGQGKTTEHPMEAQQWASEVRSNVSQWQQRAQAGLQVLKEHPQVDTSKLAAIGYCFGGATVLQLAYSDADIDGVVSFHGALPVATAEQAQQIRSQILVCHGSADTFITDDTIQQFQEALEQAGVDWQMIIYSGAKHSFTNPGADEHNIDGIAYHSEADVRSWSHMRLFLNQLFQEAG